MKSLPEFILLILACVACGAFAADEFPGVKFAEARAYAWKMEPRQTEDLLNKDMSLTPGVINKEGAVLSADQLKRVSAAVTGKHAAVPLYKCYIPHNAIVFYDENKKPVAFLEICFDCMGRRSQPRLEAQDIDYVALATVFKELKLPYGDHKSPEAIGEIIKKHNTPKNAKE